MHSRVHEVLVHRCCAPPFVSRRTIGEWLELIMVENKYYHTMLPRIPVPIARLLKVKVRAVCWGGGGVSISQKTEKCEY